MTVRDRITDFRRVPAREISGAPFNWRKHPQTQRAAVSASLEELGIIDPLKCFIATDGTLTLWDGHLREDIFQRIGPETMVPVIVTDLSEAEARKANVVFDPLAALAEADTKALDALLREVETGDEDLAKMLADLGREAGCDWAKEQAAIVEDEVPEPPVDPVTKPGDLWVLGEHRLLCGDSTNTEDAARTMNGKQADCIVTSPPYAVGIEYGAYHDTIENLREMLPKIAKLWCRILPPGGFAVINFGDIASGKSAAGTDEVCEYPMALEYWPVFRAEKWYLWSRRAWCKPNQRVNSLQCIQSNRAATDWENVWTWKRPGRPFIGRVDGTMRSCQGWCDTSAMQGVGVGKDIHGAGMPVGIAAWMINIHSRDGSIVHEPFSGTGTTLIAAEQLNRQCFAIELEPAYCDVTVQRWEKLTGQKAELSKA